MSDKYRFPRPNQFFPKFYSFVPPENDDEHPNELHYAVFGRNGPVYKLRVYPNGEHDRFKTTVYDVWMEDRAVGVEQVSFEESAWSDYYFKNDA